MKEGDRVMTEWAGRMIEGRVVAVIETLHFKDGKPEILEVGVKLDMLKDTAWMKPEKLKPTPVDVPW